jgi:hypothetical protein
MPDWVMSSRDRTPPTLTGSVSTTLSYFAPFLNLMPDVDEQRLRLKAGDKAQATLVCLPPASKVDHTSVPSFVEYGQSPSATTNTLNVNLYEGDAGRRHNIARGFADCLMRRQPLASGHDAIQTAIQFCNLYRTAIEQAMRGGLDFDLPPAKRITIDKQKTVYDLVNWRNTVKKSTGPLAATPLSGAEKRKPRWSFAVQADTSGVKITQLQLLDCDSDIISLPDPFAAAVRVLQEITFGDLFVTWDGDTTWWGAHVSCHKCWPGWELPGRRPGEGGLASAVISCADETRSDCPFPPAAQGGLLREQRSSPTRCGVPPGATSHSAGGYVTGGRNEFAGSIENTEARYAIT